MKLRSALAFAVGAALAVAAVAQTQTTLVVQVDAEPTWRDLAYLAAIPAAEAANSGGASLIAVPAAGPLGPETRDYFRRYQPTSVVTLVPESRVLDFTPSDTAPFKKLTASHAVGAAVQLSRTYWRSSPVAVVCQEDDYESALIGAPLASLLNAPLLYVPATGAPEATAAELRRLGVREVVTLGATEAKFDASAVNLSDAAAVMAWTRQRRIPVRYLAAVNPRDRGQFVTRKLSMAGAQLAAGRRGLVAPLNIATEWKRHFATTPWTKPLPAGLPSSKVPVQSGSIELGGVKAPFLLTGEDDDHGLRLALDRRGTGSFSESYRSGDTLSIGGRNWTVSLGLRTKFGDTRVHLTWPPTDDLRARLETYYRHLGAPPKHLCLVGFPDALPHAILGRGGIVEEQTSDLPFARVGNAQFAQIGVGRVIAEDFTLGSLYAARALTYNDLVQPGWATMSAQAEWETTMGPLFRNVGFQDPYQLTSDDIPWATPPTQGNPGQRAASFAADSPVAQCAVLSHSEHSWWQSLGSTFRWDAEVLMAPTVVESGGCATATLDRDPQNRSVVARLLRLGAVAYTGGSRELPAQSQPLRMEFWNGVLAGETLGEAHMRAQNAGMMATLEQGEDEDGAYRYCMQVQMLFGDPALSIQVPAAPRMAPSRTELRGDRLTLHAPAEWTVVPGHVPVDWKEWAGKDLFRVRGPGAYSLNTWSGRGRDEETALVPATFTTNRPVKSIELLDKVEAPMGWSGKWYSQANPDGTWTHRLATQMIDFDQETGEILRTVDRLQFRLTLE